MFRYNYLDLNDQGLNGGLLNGYTTGLNWFWNPNMKMQFNYNITDRNVVNNINPAFATGSGKHLRLRDAELQWTSNCS